MSWLASLMTPDALLALLLAMVLCFALGAVLALVAAPWPVFSRILAHGLALLGGASAAALGLLGVLGASLHIQVAEVLPVAGLDLTMDRLGAFFTLLVGLAAIPAALYALGYTRAYAEQPARLAWMGACFNLFLLSMALVPLANNALVFLVLWEAMSLTSYFLVMTESEDAETASAGQLYMVMTHAGLACLLVGFLLLARWTGSLDFAAWRSAGTSLTSAARGLAFVLLALGFGSKAGVIPLHIWLPRAHPAAPSHVSALMSGIMVKLGIYGLVRVSFDLLGAGPAWWGIVVLLAGMSSSVLGILFAIVERDLKRMLAFSTVENIGIILIGLGAGLLFRSVGLAAAATLAVVAALYHTLNHAMFKSLLFMGAGAVVHTTHTRNMDQLGGLIKRMPWTAALFLVGAVAIAGLPPLNGFIGEWLTFQALLLSFQIPSQALNLLCAAAVALLALTGGLAAAGFVKAFGITFLALPRSPGAEQAHEASPIMRGAMVLLALLCAALGLLPALLLPVLSKVVAGFAHLPDLAGGGVQGPTRVVVSDFGSVSPLWLAVLLGLLLLAVPIALRLLGTNWRTHVAQTWSCGRVQVTSRMEYTATAFANPVKRLFTPLYRPVRRLMIDAHPRSRFFVRTIAYSNEVRPIIEEMLYQPAVRAGHWLARRVQGLQSGSIHLYLAYILATLIVLLALAR